MLSKHNNSQNKSPIPTPSLLFSCRLKIVHNHSGYSSSANATGSTLFFSKFSPLSGVPAAILLFTSGTTFFFAASVAWPLRLLDGAGVSFSLNGWAADVEVAAGGLCEDAESPCRGAGCVAEMGVALEKCAEDVKRRVDLGRRGDWALEAARRQLRQIMVGVVGLAIGLRHGV